jgi:rare lipoprotein A
MLGCALLLTSCGPPGKFAGILDPRYGVSSSPRVVAFGQPVPKGGGTYRVGKPYVVGGRTYVPEENTSYRAEGLASWYGEDFHGRLTANGEVYDMNSISAAHPTLPIPSYARVTNLQNGRSIIVRVNDRGPFKGNRLIDLSARTAKLLEFHGHGLARVRVEYVGRASLDGSDDRKLLATLREGKPAPAPSAIMLASNKPVVTDFGNGRPIRGEVPVPADRPFSLGDPDRQPRVATYPDRIALNERASSAGEVTARARAAQESRFDAAFSSVSSVAVPRYDAPLGYMSGRGLY